MSCPINQVDYFNSIAQPIRGRVVLRGWGHCDGFMGTAGGCLLEEDREEKPLIQDTHTMMYFKVLQYYK